MRMRVHTKALLLYTITRDTETKNGVSVTPYIHLPEIYSYIYPHAFYLVVVVIKQGSLSAILLVFLHKCNKCYIELYIAESLALFEFQYISPHKCGEQCKIGYYLAVIHVHTGIWSSDSGCM